MNEQLQKIAEDAGVDARTMGFESNQHHRDPWNARLEKFAELIIEECAQTCDVVRESNGGDKSLGARFCADEIRAINRRVKL